MKGRGAMKNMMKNVVLSVLNNKLVNEVYRVHYIVQYPLGVVLLGVHSAVNPEYVPMCKKLADRMTDTVLAAKPLRFAMEAVVNDLSGKGIL